MSVLNKKRVIITISILALLYLIKRFLHDAFINDYTPTTLLKRTNATPLLVMVYYEALCPDSKHFIMKQLQPTHAKLAPFIDLQLIPYGKAKTTHNPDDSYSFECQHGALECEANMYHACAVDLINDSDKRLQVVACMINDNRRPKEALLKCAKHHEVANIDLILKCFENPAQGKELLKLHGEATHALRQAMTFVPTITLDGSQGRQAAILKNLYGEICKILGDIEECNTQNSPQQ